MSSSTKLVKTSDGGLTWQTLSIPGISVTPSVSVKKTVFTTPLVGHAVCNSRRIMKTVDGGVTWYFTELTTNNSTDFITVYFANQNVGYASDTFSELMKTTDGGETWTQLQNISIDIRTIFFLDQNKGYVAGDFGFVYKTNNGGATWQAVNTPNSSMGQMDLNGIYFTNANNGFCAGVRGRILKTTNGSSWTPYSPSYLDVRSIDFVSNDEGFTLFGNQCYYTNDGGLTWTYRGEIDNQSYIPTKIEFVNANVGYMAAGSRIYKTLNGGITWTNTTGLNIDIKYIDFIDENTGYVSGHNDPKLFRTTNGGSTWQLVSNQINNNLQIINANIGYSLRNGQVFKTTNGGNTWNATFNDDPTYYNLDFINENEGIAIGITSTRRTADGGLTWQVYNNNIPNIGSMFTYFKFVSSNIGYIANESGNIYTTTDGGESWGYVPGIQEISTMTFNNGYLYVGGTWGKISRKQNNLLSEPGFNIMEKNITVYPVPVIKDLNIGTENLIIDKIEIFDLSGKNMLIQNVDANSNGVYDVSRLESGVYIIKIYSEGKVHNQKFIKS